MVNHRVDRRPGSCQCSVGISHHVRHLITRIPRDRTEATRVPGGTRTHHRRVPSLGSHHKRGQLGLTLTGDLSAQTVRDANHHRHIGHLIKNNRIRTAISSDHPATQVVALTTRELIRCAIGNLAVETDLLTNGVATRRVVIHRCLHPSEHTLGLITPMDTTVRIVNDRPRWRPRSGDNAMLNNVIRLIDPHPTFLSQLILTSELIHRVHRPLTQTACRRAGTRLQADPTQPVTHSKRKQLPRLNSLTLNPRSTTLLSLLNRIR